MSVQTQASGLPTNVNTASADTLAMNVMGIGPALAQRIVAYREAHGSFSSIGELIHVPGIAHMLLARIRDQITVGGEMAVEQGTGSDAGAASEKGGSMADENRNEEEQVGEQISAGAEDQRPDAVVPWAERLPSGEQDFSEEVEPVAEPESEIEPALAPDFVPEAQESELESELGEPAWEAEAALAESEEPAWEAEAVLAESEEPAWEAEAGLESEEPAWEAEAAMAESEEQEWEAEPALGPAYDESEWETEPVLGSEAEEPELETEAEAGLAPEFAEPEMETELGAEVEPVGQESSSAFVTYVEGPETVDTSEAVIEEEEGEIMSADAMTVTGAERRAVERAEARAEPEPVVQYVERRSSPWRSVLLVLLGGIAGVLLTLLVAVIWTGTVSFAPRAEVDALSRNLDTIYGNQELAWERIDQLVTRANELDAEVTQLRALRDQFGAMEGELQAAQAEVEAAQATLTNLQQDLGQLETDLRGSMGEIDQRVQTAEGDIADMSASLQTVETQVERVGVFFGGLRDLLNNMEGLPEATPEG
jgi:competence ComEA-like helix-hairpin-helix protein